jgi:hypothetical protein
MKWICCARSESVDPQTASLLLQNLQRADSPTLLRDPSDALALGSKQWLSVVRRHTAGRSDASAVFIGPSNIGSLLLPTCPVRADIQALLDAIRLDGAQSEQFVSLSMCVMTGPTLGADTRNIALQLAETAAIDSSIARPSSGRGVGFDSFLKLNFGQRRQLGDAVELRSVVEFDEIVGVLFSSRAFQGVLPTVSMRIDIKSSSKTSVRDEADDAPYWYSNACHSFWFLSSAHALQYPQQATRQAGLPILLFQFFSQIPELVKAGELIDALEQRKGAAAAQQPTLDASPISARIKGVSEALHAAPAPGDTSPSHPFRNSGESLEGEHANLEDQFNAAVHQYREEAAAMKETETELAAWVKKIEATDAERDSAERLKQELVEELSRLSSIKLSTEQKLATTASARSAAAQEIASEAAALNQEVERSKQGAPRDELERAEVAAEAARREALQEVASWQVELATRREELRAERDRATIALAAAEAARQKMAERLAEAAAMGAASKAALVAMQQRVADAQRAVQQLSSLGWSEGTIAADKRVAEFEASRVAAVIEELRLEKARLLAEKQRHDTHIPALCEKLRNKTEEGMGETVDLRLRVASRNKTALCDAERSETLRRASLRLSEATAREELGMAEVRSWHDALYATELAFVSSGESKVRAEISGSEQECESLLLTLTELRGKAAQLQQAVASSAMEHAELLRDTRTHLTTIQHEELAMLEYDTSQERFSFPELDKEAELLQTTMQRLRVCMTTGTVGQASPVAGRAGTLSVTVAGRAKAAGRVVPDGADVLQRLRLLISDAKGQEEAWSMARDTALHKCEREEREHDERRAVLAQTLQHADATKRRIDQCALNTKSRFDELDVRRSRHEQLVAKLREEQDYAEVVSARHRDEVDTHMRELRDRGEELQAELERTKRELKKVESRAEGARLESSAAHTETIRLQLLREEERAAELRSQLR